MPGSSVIVVEAVRSTNTATSRPNSAYKAYAIALERVLGVVGGRQLPPEADCAELAHKCERGAPRPKPGTPDEPQSSPGRCRVGTAGTWSTRCPPTSATSECRPWPIEPCLGRPWTD